MHSKVAGALALIVNIFLALFAAFNNFIYAFYVIKSSIQIALHFSNAYFLINSTITLSISILPKFISLTMFYVTIPCLSILTTANHELTSPIFKNAILTPGLSLANF